MCPEPSRESEVDVFPVHARVKLGCPLPSSAHPKRLSNPWNWESNFCMLSVLPLTKCPSFSPLPEQHHVQLFRKPYSKCTVHLILLCGSKWFFRVFAMFFTGVEYLSWFCFSMYSSLCHFIFAGPKLCVGVSWSAGFWFSVKLFLQWTYLLNLMCKKPNLRD